MEFSKFGLNEGLLEALGYMGFVEATPIQVKAIPQILEGKDLIAAAQTGTGKTAAFILPILHKLTQEQDGNINTLVLAPTRELAIQIDNQIQAFTYFTNITSIAIYGGSSGGDFAQQKKALTHGADIIVATPGKLQSHLNMGYVKFGNIKHVILDEADRMLDIGFYDDIIKIIKHTPKSRQTLLFSATMPPKIKKLSQEILKNPSLISIALSKPAEGVTQEIYKTNDNQKVPLIDEIIKKNPDFGRIIVFSSTKKNVSKIVRSLKSKGYNAEGISSDLVQTEREAVVNRFRSKQTRIIVATDVLARGIDIKDIDLVVNFDVPGDAESYVHRIGRTARAETKGLAVTLVNRDDNYKFKQIEKLIDRRFEFLPLPEKVAQIKGSADNHRSSSRNRSGNRNQGNRNNRNNNHRNKNRNNRNKSSNRNHSTSSRNNDSKKAE